ncbi:TetR/AcrR family transcriptional regulator [Pseudomonas sp. KCJK8993]|uniref:TetR/AcrR family transcriptional regulator n=1 Tax=Pseudomonas sp. KCJK8993 TaxID=3344565 RepID=UPI003905E76A
MTDTAPSSSKLQRTPKQTRGHQRVTAILQACARLLIQLGVANLTMHGIAREAGTSIGSLYHFFSDKQQVLKALGQGHIAAMSAIAEPLRGVDESHWRGLSSRQVIEQTTLPLLQYIEQHPDLLQMLTPGYALGQLQAPDLHIQMQKLYDRVLTVRLPLASARQRETHVQALLGLPLGLFQRAQEHQELKRELLLEEVPRALEAYLAVIEGLYRQA